MVCFRILFLALVLALCAPLHAKAEIERVTVGGHTYLRARDWAKANRLEPAWVTREKTMQLANGTTRIVIEMDSREITFNGISVALSRPVVYRNEAVYVSQLDATTVLAPLLNPPRLPAGKKIKTICLDPGHGGKDPGNQAAGRSEKKYTLLLAEELQRQLTRLGFKVVLTRKRDSSLDLEGRPVTAKKLGADIFVSLHFNGTPTAKNTVRGAETYCLTPAGASSTNAGGAGARAGSSRGNSNDDENVCLAFQIQRALIRTLNAEDRGVRRARFAVLRDAAMPAVLVEAGFMSHPTEGRKIADAAYRKQMARAITDGIVAYKKSVEQGN